MTQTLQTKGSGLSEPIWHVLLEAQIPHKRFEPTIPASARQQTYALGRGHIEARTDTAQQSGQTSDRKHKWATVLLIAVSTLNPIRLACYL
jgi:hypothetical protein